MYRRNKEELEGLQVKRDQVECDKNQISAVIQELDDKKKAALKNTWEQVGGARPCTRTIHNRSTAPACASSTGVNPLPGYGSGL
jgi:hypothetical protein